MLDAAALLLAESGHATVFRRFPTKESLIAAVVGERLQELAAFAERALERADARAALEAFVWEVGELQQRDRALFEGLERCVGHLLAAKRRSLRDLLAQLLARAQEQGALRSDVGLADVVGLVRAAILAGLEASPVRGGAISPSSSTGRARRAFASGPRARRRRAPSARSA